MKQSTIIRLNGMAYLIIAIIGMGFISLGYICPQAAPISKLTRAGFLLWGVINLLCGSWKFMGLLLEITRKRNLNLNIGQISENF